MVLGSKTWTQTPQRPGVHLKGALEVLPRWHDAMEALRPLRLADGWASECIACNCYFGETIWCSTAEAITTPAPLHYTHTRETPMRLSTVHVTEFQSIRDSNEFSVGDITCLVGKNEAGKTALLQALYRLNPIVPAEGNYDVTDDYPRWDVEDYRLSVESGEQEQAVVVAAVFTLEAADLAEVEVVFGKGVLPEGFLTASQGYSNEIQFDLSVDVPCALNHLISSHELTPEAEAKLRSSDSFETFASTLGEVEQTESVKTLRTLAAQVMQSGGLDEYIFNVILWPRAPKFLYFDEFYQMKGRANIEGLKLRKQQGKLERSDHPLLGLVGLARLDLDDLLAPTRTRELKNALEGAGNHLTKRVVKYWSQNRYLELRFDVRPARPEDPLEMRSGTNLWADVYDSKHRVTTELGTRSKGFVWFFSFLAWYGDVRRRHENVILLLDEPGLSLHGKAQGDLLLYFDDEVKHQLIYTTHSPFMVDPGHFERVRIVQDLSIEGNEELPPDKEGTKVIVDVLEATDDSLFPLQGALGYELTQTLFVGPNSLVVEGVSDLLYLQAMSAVLEANGRVFMDARWTITPVGGADKVPTFVALVGAQRGLNVAVLVDFEKKQAQSILNLYRKKLLQKKKVLTFADFVQAAEADVEDMFEPGFYLRLVNEAYKQDLVRPVEDASLDHHLPRITSRLAAYFDANPLKGAATWNHYRPARYLVDHMTSLEKGLSEKTLVRFEEVFRRLSSLLPRS